MKKIERKCQGCSCLKDRAEMIKITLHKGSLVINPDSKTLGRSIYVCKNSDCIKTLIKKKRIKSGLKYSNTEQIEAVENKLTELI